MKKLLIAVVVLSLALMSCQGGNQGEVTRIEVTTTPDLSGGTISVVPPPTISNFSTPVPMSSPTPAVVPTPVPTLTFVEATTPDDQVCPSQQFFAGQWVTPNPDLAEGFVFAFAKYTDYARWNQRYQNDPDFDGILNRLVAKREQEFLSG